MNQQEFADSDYWAVRIVIGVLVWWATALGTHVWVCGVTGWWWFLFAGTVFFPAGVVHGTGVWFGLW